MIFTLISIVVPIALYFLVPILISFFTGKQVKSRWLLAIAGVMFFISWYLPSPLIDGKNTAFMTHFVGGGIFTGFLWGYIKQQVGWKTTWWVELASLYALVSALGVANELFELFVVKAGLLRLDPSDTWWDLLANTLGAVVFWVGWKMVASLTRKK